MSSWMAILSSWMRNGLRESACGAGVWAMFRIFSSVSSGVSIDWVSTGIGLPMVLACA